ncbi:MAG: Ig-like domain-containing protein [Myxococcales bacterium]|nr:MAG: Ig-like domain-containing protein [Myxococcales bacterium]
MSRNRWFLFAFFLCGCDLAERSVSSDQGGPELLVFSPEAGAQNVVRNPILVADFNQRLHPSSIQSANLRLISGTRPVPLALRWDMVESRVIASPESAAGLKAGVIYRWVLQNLQNLRGEPQSEQFVLQFRTGSEYDEELAASEPVGFAAVMPIFEQKCAIKACHDSAERSVLGLDLSSAEGIRTTAIGMPSKQFFRSTAGLGGSAGARTLSDLAILDVLAAQGRAARSYLMYKVLADPVILGEPMPPPELGLELDREELQMLQSWITQGAPTE